MRNSIIKNLNNAKVISIKPLEMRVISKKGVKKSLAINEVSILDKADKLQIYL